MLLCNQSKTIRTLSMSEMICRISWSCLRSSPCLKMTGYMAPSSVLKISLAGIRALWYAERKRLTKHICKGVVQMRLFRFLPWTALPSRVWCPVSWSEAPEEEESAQSPRDSPFHCQPAKPAAAPSADTHTHTHSAGSVLLQMKRKNDFVWQNVNNRFF